MPIVCFGNRCDQAEVSIAYLHTIVPKAQKNTVLRLTWTQVLSLLIAGRVRTK